MHSHHFLQPILSFPARRFPYADSLIANNEKDHCACKALGPRTLQRSFFLASRPGCTSTGRIEDCSVCTTPTSTACGRSLSQLPPANIESPQILGSSPAQPVAAEHVVTKAIHRCTTSSAKTDNIGGRRSVAAGQGHAKKKNGFVSWCFLLEKYSSVGTCRFQAALYFITLGLFLAITPFYFFEFFLEVM